MQGTMLWFNRDKGYGFIRTKNGDRLYVARHGFLPSHEPQPRCKGREINFHRQSACALRSSAMRSHSSARSSRSREAISALAAVRSSEVAKRLRAAADRYRAAFARASYPSVRSKRLLLPERTRSALALMTSCSGRLQTASRALRVPPPAPRLPDRRARAGGVREAHATRPRCRCRLSRDPFERSVRLSGMPDPPLGDSLFLAAFHCALRFSRTLASDVTPGVGQITSVIARAHADKPQKCAAQTPLRLSRFRSTVTAGPSDDGAATRKRCAHEPANSGMADQAGRSVLR